MGFEGSVLAMINTLKNNKKLLARRKTFKDRRKEFSYKKGNPLKFKELPEKELNELKVRIKAKLKKERRIKTTVIIVLMMLLVYLSITMFNIINNRTIEKQTRELEQQRIYFEWQEKENAKRKEARIVYYLNKGYGNLSQGNYQDAKYFFYKAKQQDKSDYRVMIGYAKAYVYDCVFNDRECEYIDEILTNLKSKIGTSAEVLELIELYTEKQTLPNNLQ
ncbi:hypothetical protein KDU71_00040 [Carboxylicivirga sediminis]|uniref:Tetratricopeptide repeat protein n=1 Tax=Carboxylicivirga sediminis TaxID=2006564 RepID=A0A941F033_9BACT|nr:hypothetical protein [Carboxylicivirga sediminis]MBR8533933.1 hypothetical protein [Carboxylicivirga sediminis]